MAWEKGIAIQSRLKIPPISTRSKENPIIITIKSILFIGLFLTFAAALHPVQFLAIPLYWIHRPLFRSVQNYVKRAWAIFLIFITQVFGPSTLVITSDIVEEDFVLYKAGQPTVKLPHKAVVIANHQVYSDWIYLWIIAYFAHRHGSVLIMLKQSLKWIPILGPAMQFFNFIWMKRNWLQDQKPLASYLLRLVTVHREHPMMLIIFPEGTLVSPETRPLSEKYAKKMGIDDLKNVLLPRSTGLRFCLQKLEKGVDYVYDFTIAYEGIPSPEEGKYGQEYFTLRSIYFAGQSPPRVHLHVRRFPLSDIPFNDQSAFDDWLRDRWKEKDSLLKQFYKNDRFPVGKDGKTYHLATKTRHVYEWGHIYGFGLPFIVAGLLWKLVKR